MFYASYKRYWEPSTPEALAIGTVAGSIGALATYPFDYLKTKSIIRVEGIGLRQKSQEMGVNCFAVFRQFHSRGYGFQHLYTGLQAGFLSRMGFLTIRNLVYKIIYDIKKPPKPTNDLTWGEKRQIAAIAAIAGTIATNPLDVIKIRQISDLGRPEKFQRGYKTLGDAFNHLNTKAGGGLYVGLTANLLRAVVLNTVMIYPYDKLRDSMWNTFGDVFVNKVVATIGAAVVGTVASLPFENIRIRIMNLYADQALNRLDYTKHVPEKNKITIYGVIRTSIRTEGVNCFFVGMYPHFLHVLGYSFLTLYISDWWVTARKRGAGIPEHKI